MESEVNAYSLIMKDQLCTRGRELCQNITVFSPVINNSETNYFVSSAGKSSMYLMFIVNSKTYTKQQGSLIITFLKSYSTFRC